jgi:hypothetical protein
MSVRIAAAIVPTHTPLSTLDCAFAAMRRQISPACNISASLLGRATVRSASQKRFFAWLACGCTCARPRHSRVADIVERQNTDRGLDRRLSAGRPVSTHDRREIQAHYSRDHGLGGTGERPIPYALLSRLARNNDLDACVHGRRSSSEVAASLGPSLVCSLVLTHVARLLSRLPPPMPSPAQHELLRAPQRGP